MLFIFYMLIVFARIKNNQGIISLLRNKAHRQESSRQRYYSLAGDSQQADENEATSISKKSSNQNGTAIDLEQDVYDDDTEDEAKHFVIENHPKNRELEEIQTKIYNGPNSFNFFKIYVRIIMLTFYHLKTSFK